MAVGQLHTGWGHDTPGVPRGVVHRWAGGWGEEIWGWLLGVWEKRGGWYEVLPDCWVDGGVAVEGGGGELHTGRGHDMCCCWCTWRSRFTQVGVPCPPVMARGCMHSLLGGSVTVVSVSIGGGGG